MAIVAAITPLTGKRSRPVMAHLTVSVEYGIHCLLWLVSSGDTPLSSRDLAELQGMLKPFVYRRYIDYSAIESLRRMKQLIEQENRRRNRVDNIKLGAGGIREVEFIIQTLQLIRGGRIPAIQQQSIFAAMQALLQAMGPAHGFSAHQIPSLELGGERVSASRIA